MVMFVMMLIPGFPKLQLLVLGAMLVVLGVMLMRTQRELAAEADTTAQEMSENREGSISVPPELSSARGIRL